MDPTPRPQLTPEEHAHIDRIGRRWTIGGGLATLAMLILLLAAIWTSDGRLAATGALFGAAGFGCFLISAAVTSDDVRNRLARRKARAGDLR